MLTILYLRIKDILEDKLLRVDKIIIVQGDEIEIMSYMPLDLTCFRMCIIKHFVSIVK